MRIVSLTIPKPTLRNEEEIKTISLTIKSKSNGMQIIDTWPYAFPRYKYDIDDQLEISIYYKLKNSSNKTNSDEIHLHSVIYFPCILLDEIDKKGKKQWILGLDKFQDNNTNKLLMNDISIENSLKQIKIMEEKAKRSFKISKIYLIFYSCNKTVLNIEEQLTSNYNTQSNYNNNNACDLLLTENHYEDYKKFDENSISKYVKEDINLDKSKSSFGIRPEDSISKISAKTTNSNTISRTNLIKQNLTENNDNLSDAIEMINKYRRNKSKGLSYHININQNYKTNILNDFDHHKEQVNNNTITKIQNIDTASIISKTISTNTQKYLEKKKLQERLLTLQYYFSLWRQESRKERNFKESKKNVKIMSGLINLLLLFEKNQRFKKMTFITSLKINRFFKEMKKKEFNLEQITNEKNILAEKLNNIILENCEKFQKINQNILIKEKDIYELRKKLEYYDNKNNELNNEIENIKNENKKFIHQIKELKDYIQDQEKLIESDKVKNNKEKIEMEIIIDRRKKEYSRQLEEIHCLNDQLNEYKNRNELLINENNEFNKKLITLEEEKLNIINEFNQNILLKSKENEELYMENIKFKEDNELLIKNINRLTEENNNYIKICEELKSEKSSLIDSVYDLINQIENEKIERIQELENSRILFQSINNNNISNSGNSNNNSNINNYNRHKKIMNLYNKEDLVIEEDEDLTLEDLKYTMRKGRSVNISIDKEEDVRRVRTRISPELVVGETCIEITGEKEYKNYYNEEIEKEFDKLREREERMMMMIEIINGIQICNNNNNNNQLVKLNSIEIIGKSELVKKTIREVRLEFYDEEYENIKLKNEQIMDLSERVRVLTDEMKKLKEKEKEEEKEREEKDYINNKGLIDFNLDDTERIIGSATEMFKLALRNIKMNNNNMNNNDNINNGNNGNNSNNNNDLYEELENYKSKVSIFGLDQDEMKSDIEESSNSNSNNNNGIEVINSKNNKESTELNDSQMLMIVPSEFSFGSNHCNRKSDLSLSSSSIGKKLNDDHLVNNYHQYNNSVENNNTSNNNEITNDLKGNMFKLGYDKIVSTISSALISNNTSTSSTCTSNSNSTTTTTTTSGSLSGTVSRIGSPMIIKGNEMNYSQMTKNNPIILQFPMVRSSSQSPGGALSRSNSLRYSSSSGGNNNNNNNIGGYYYQYNMGEKVYKINDNNNNNIGKEENSYQKRYSSLPRHNIRTIPPPFFPRN
ncbi:unnamed protein product [Cryptosporidium hominis]|uniref:C2 NT-type domain-containing protein n=2 Tax=Cryptosporidium hominis TaxID=237895 RepID=A0A0S4TCJ4_CRYHO|nr:Uncharacterized protein GY17_00003562 [Cryptosporidium hominis]CUV04765.1 unnamed protein product [Cryptosporidium hominis]|eukprot:PPS94427.1 Uncharacterized protein GY17_00003562 [Cryptosporidium hominis]